MITDCHLPQEINTTYLLGGVLNKGIAPGFTLLWATCVPQEILSCDLSKGGKHLDNIRPKKKLTLQMSVCRTQG
jgi:hypothetical protein